MNDVTSYADLARCLNVYMMETGSVGSIVLPVHYIIIIDHQALYDVKRAIGGARTGLAEKAGYTIVPKKRKNTSKK